MKSTSGQVSTLETFSQAYIAFCQVHSLPVSTDVLHPDLDSLGRLTLQVEKLKRDEDWVPVLKALKKDRNLKGIFIYSNDGIQINGNQNKLNGINKQIIPVLRVLAPLSSCIKENLIENGNVTRLQITGIQLSKKALQLLSQGISQSFVLREISLSRSKIGDHGLKLLSPAIRSKSQTIQLLDFSGCNLTSKGALILASILKSQFVKIQTLKWENSLRGRPAVLSPQETQIGCLERLTLNSNDLKDEGVDFLMDLLSEEIGLLALDLQNNKATHQSAELAIQTLKMNKEIQIVDLRNNNFDNMLLNDISTALETNRILALSQAESKNEPIKLCPWLDALDPLRHTFYETKNNVRIRKQTQSSVRKRSSGIENIPIDKQKDKLKSHSVSQRPLTAPASSQIQQKKSFYSGKPSSLRVFEPTKVAPMLPNNSEYDMAYFHVEPSQPCHKLIYDGLKGKSNPTLNTFTKQQKTITKKKTKSVRKSVPKEKILKDLEKENKVLKERLETLEKGISNVTHVLSGQKKQHEIILSSKKDDVLSIKSEGSTGQHAIEHLIKLMETSLGGFHAMLDSIEHKRAKAKRKKAERLAVP